MFQPIHIDLRPLVLLLLLRSILILILYLPVLLILKLLLGILHNGPIPLPPIALEPILPILHLLKARSFLQLMP